MRPGLSDVHQVDVIPAPGLVFFIGLIPTVTFDWFHSCVVSNKWFYNAEVTPSSSAVWI